MNTFFFTFKKEIGATLPKNPLFNQLKINLCLDLVLLRNRLHPGPKTIVPKLFGSLWVSCSFCVSFSLFLSLFLIDTIEDDTKKTNGCFKLYFPHLISIARDGAPPGVVLHGNKTEERQARKTHSKTNLVVVTSLVIGIDMNHDYRMTKKENKFLRYFASCMGRRKKNGHFTVRLTVGVYPPIC